MTVYEALLIKDPECKSSLLSGMGLIYLQVRSNNKLWILTQNAIHKDANCQLSYVATHLS